MKKNKKRFYQLLFSFAIVFLFLSLISLWLSQPNGRLMPSEMTMGIVMTGSMFSHMNLTDVLLPMGKMMGMTGGMMPSNPLYDVLNLVLTLALMISTAILIGASIILIMLWIPIKKFRRSP